MMLLRSATGRTTSCTPRQKLCHSSFRRLPIVPLLRRQQRQLTVNNDHVFNGYHHRFGDTSTNMFSTTTTTGSNNDDVSTITSTTSTSTSTVTNNNKDELPLYRTKILSLYRSILRLHEKALPKQLRDIGNVYIQSEFRTLKDTKKVTLKHVQNFIMEWEKYQQQIVYQYNQQQQQMRGDDVTASTTSNTSNTTVKYGQSLPSDIPLTTEQQEQLRKIHQEVTTTSTNNSTTTQTGSTASASAAMINAIITNDNKLG